MPPTLFLGHGASGNAASMASHVAGLERRGIAAQAVDLPRGKAEAAVRVWRVAVPDGHDTAVGGQSFGGRVSSLAAAEPGADYAAIVLFSYPLHPPGDPGKAEARVAHWPALTCPVLLLSGESDPFARIELLRTAVGLLANAELVTYPKLGHSLRPVLNDALDRVATFLHEIRG